MASNPPGRCCITGVKHEGTAKGELKEFGGVSTYFSYPEDKQTETAILVLTDFFGNEFINIQLIADQFAANGYLVVVPDLYEGDAVPLNMPKDFDIMAWGMRGGPQGKGHGPGQVDPIIEIVIAAMRGELGVKRIGAVGYCFGAKYVARFLAEGKGVDVGAMAHPSFVDVAEVKAMARPVTIAAAEVDHIFSDEKRHETERLLKDGKKIYSLHLYSGVEHGFAVRSDISKKHVKFAKEAAFLQHVHWFDHWLKESRV